MFKEKWKEFLTDTEIIPTNTPLIPLRILFILASASTIIFYRFVYIYTHNQPIAKYLHDYHISYIGKTYIEGVCLTLWVIFLIVFLLRISNTLYIKFILPLIRIFSLVLIEILYLIDFLIEKTYNLIKKEENKDFTNPKKNTKIIRNKKEKKETNDKIRRSKASLLRSQRKIKK